MQHSEIINLIQKFKSGQISAEELNRLKQLLDSSTPNDDLHSLLDSSFDDLLNTEHQLAPFPTQEIVKNRLLLDIRKDEAPTIKRSKINVFVKFAGIAAVLALVAYLFFPRGADPIQPHIEWTSVTTKHGQRKKLTLSDGTSILLNGNTTIAYPISGVTSLRLVKLRGEAFFDVAKNDEKAFVVVSDKFTTRVVGTSFNIDSDIEQAIEVNSGKVDIYALEQHDILPRLTTDKDKSKNLFDEIETLSRSSSRLQKGDKATLSKEGWLLSNVKTNGWRDNELVYLNETLGKVVAKAYRFYGDSIAVSPSLSHKKISITFRHKNINQVVNTLSELSGGILTKEEKNNIWKITKK